VIEMDDLRARFASLDDVGVPDLWPEIERRAASPSARVVPAATILRPAPEGETRGQLSLTAGRWLVVLAAVLAAALVGAVLLVAATRRQAPTIVPPSAVALPSLGVTFEVPSAAVVQPSPSATSATPLGGRRIVTHAYAGFSDGGAHEVYALDAGTGDKALLGSIPGASSGGYAYAYAFQRDPAGTHTLILAGWPTDLVDLQSPTDASAPFGFVGRGDLKGPGSLDLLSPLGDEVATVADADNATSIRIHHLDGSPLTVLPADLTKAAWPGSWAPDETALVATGCRPCNKAPTPLGRQTPEHRHLYIVPADGSSWHELIDEDNGSLAAVWSPTADTLAVTDWTCGPGLFMPRCPPERSSLSLLTLSDEVNHPIATSTTIAEWPAWSPDGSRIAFIGGTAHGEEMRNGAIYVADADGSNVTRIADATERRAPIWSPDGQWLLYETPGSDGSSHWWIVPSNGGEPRDLGPFGGMAW
jgi:hypothetical protein